MAKKVLSKNSNNLEVAALTQTAAHLSDQIIALVQATRSKVAVYLNAEASLMYWSIGNYIDLELKQKQQIQYGKQILATLSQELTQKLGKGFSYSEEWFADKLHRAIAKNNQQ